MSDAEFDDFNDFLSYEGRGPRSGSFLKKWKKEPGHFDAWMHVKRPPRPVWRHQFPKIIVKDEVKHVYGVSWNCHESDAVLKKQFKFNKQTQMREFPPEKCPICRLIDTIRMMVNADKLSWVDEVFKFEGDVSDEDIVLHAAGLYNMFGSKNLTSEEKKQMAKHGIYAKNAWKENAQAKLQYAMCVVNNDKPEDGMQIAIENGLLGDKIKGVIRDTQLDLGVDEGNPGLNPYAIRWIYREKEQEFSKKYHATKMSKLPLSEEIEDLIRQDPPPDISGVIAPFKAGKERAFFEAHALVDLPWDDIFEGHEATDSDEESEDSDEAPESSKRTPEVPAKKPDVKKAEEKAPKKEKEEPASKTRSKVPSEDDPRAVACDECNKPMWVDDTVCPHCDHDYAPAPKKEEPPPKQLMTRKEMAAKQAAEAAAKSEKSEKKADPKKGEKADKKKDEDEDDFKF